MHTGSDILDADVFLRGADLLFDAAQTFPDLEFMDFQKIYIAGSSIKKSDIPARLIPVLDWRSRPNGLI